MGLRDAAETFAVKLAIRRVAASKEYGPMFKKVKDFLNGKKTAIGMVILFLPQIVDGTGIVVNKVVSLLVAFDVASPEKAAAVAGAMLVAVGFAHKVVKGVRSAMALLAKFGVIEGPVPSEDEAK